MTELRQDVIRELRRIASEGASVPDLLRIVLNHAGNDATSNTFTLVRYFREAFQLPLQAVTPIGGWVPTSAGEISDARIHELIHPEILKRKPIWGKLEGTAAPGVDGASPLLNLDETTTRN